MAPLVLDPTFIAILGIIGSALVTTLLWSFKAGKLEQTINTLVEEVQSLNKTVNKLSRIVAVLEDRSNREIAGGD